LEVFKLVKVLVQFKISLSAFVKSAWSRFVKIPKTIWRLEKVSALRRLCYNVCQRVLLFFLPGCKRGQIIQRCLSPRRNYL